MSRKPESIPGTYSQELKDRVRSFWDAKPCGVKNARASLGTKRFYDQIETHRYRQEFHIPLIAEFDAHPGEQVLEIGGGVGTDGRQFARGGAHYIDIDLSFKSLALAKEGFEVYRLPGRFANGDAENLPFRANTFDLIYSHGVLHHTPDTSRAINEIYRVLKPGGKAIVMLYARESLSYVAAHVIGRLRLEVVRIRLGSREVNKLLGLPPQQGWWLPAWAVINNSTDGVGNPLSRMYNAAETHDMFSGFSSVSIAKHYIPRSKIPLIGPMLPRRFAFWLGRIMGSFWYIKAVK